MSSITKLTKSISRSTTINVRNRDLVATLRPDNTLVLHLKGLRHHEVKVHLLDILHQFSGANTPGVSIPSRPR